MLYILPTNCQSMSKFFLLITFSLCTFIITAQKKAVTETGETVVLYNDGRWSYLTRDSVNMLEVTTNPTPFKKSDNATFLIKSKRVNIGCWIDPEIWSFQEVATHNAAEFELYNESMGLYGMIITENLELPLESLANIAFDNARKAAPDAKLTSKEIRNVNGLRVLKMEMTGTIQDIAFAYYGYYYTSEATSVQFLLWSSVDTVNEHKAAIEELLNGFVEVKE